MLPVNDVLIVGGGPTGLLLAGDLAATGVSCTLLERRDTESNLTRAFGVHARTLELLDARGVAQDLIATGVTVSSWARSGSPSTHLPSRFPYLLITPQYETERLLDARARALGAEIVTGAEVVGLRQDPEGVDLTVRDTGGEKYTRRARYVVGADGAHSVVRRALGLPFPGRAAVRSVMICDVRLTDPTRDAVTARAAGDGFVFMAPFGDGWYRVIAWTAGTSDPRPRRSTSRRSATRRAASSAPTSACTTRDGSPVSTATNARCRATATAGSSSPATPRTSTPRPAAWA